jgi:ABC-type dipeptide/oligopeptide/nickel transport system permease subunit
VVFQETPPMKKYLLFIAFFPILVVALNFLGDGLQDALDPKATD